MPDYQQTLSDRLWEILEGDAAVAALFTVGRRDKVPTAAGFLRRTIARAPADFPRIELRVGGGTHSAFNGVPAGVQPTLASEATTITAIAGPEFEVYRTARVTITVWHELTTTAGANPYIEDTITALMKSGPRLGNTSLITGWGGIDHSTRQMRRNELGSKQSTAGEVSTITFTIRTRQVGKLTIA